VAGLDEAEPEVLCAPVGDVAVAVAATWLAGSTYAVAVIVPVSWLLGVPELEEDVSGASWTP
jgi:hypothetical protein